MINKAVVYGILAAFITIVYVAIVVGVGALVGSGGNAVLSAVAAAVIAVAFQPARRRAQRLANRVVYGRPRDAVRGPVRVLRTARGYVLDRGRPSETRARARRRRRRHEGRDLPGVRRPRADGGLVSGRAGSLGDERVFEVRHQGELLGRIAIAMPPNESLVPAQEKLVADVATQAGLVLRNAALIEDLRASRQRLVAAQDEERRRIERNIHDGAQQQLVALAVKLRLADALVGKDEERAHALLGELHGETSQALEDLRDLARGIYPPLLADKGLAAALEGQARKSTVPVTVDVGRDRSLPAGDRGRRVLLVSRGAAEHREVRGRLGGDDPARTVERQLDVRRRPTTASASIRRPPRAAPDSRGSRTDLPRSAANSQSDRHPATARPSPAASPFTRRVDDDAGSREWWPGARSRWGGRSSWRAALLSWWAGEPAPSARRVQGSAHGAHRNARPRTPARRAVRRNRRLDREPDSPPISSAGRSRSAL